MIKIVRAIYAASTLSEANSLTNYFTFQIIFTNWIWFVNSFDCVSDGNVWLPGKRAEIRKRIASESLQKIRTTFYEVAGHVGRVKTVITNHLRELFRNRINKVAECNTTARINWDKTWNQFLRLSQTFCYWDKQQSADSNIIQLHLTLKCTKDQSSHFCDCFLVSKWIFQHYDHCLTKFHAGCEQPLVRIVINSSYPKNPHAR